jgi:hypothetical protein
VLHLVQQGLALNLLALLLSKQIPHVLAVPLES